MSPLNS